VKKDNPKIEAERGKLSWPLVGNNHIVDFLSRSIARDQVGSAYIFFGPKDLGKATVANFFAKNLLCQDERKSQAKEVLPCRQCPSCQAFNAVAGSKESLVKEDGAPVGAHGDYHFIKREEGKKNISIEQIRDFIKDLGLSSLSGSYKIGIINEAQTLSLEAANALLKTLEEPRKKVVIILITDNLDLLPATIISRSQVLNFNPVKTDVIYDYLVDDFGVARSLAKNLSRICLGRPALAVKLLQDKSFYKNYTSIVRVFLDFSRQDLNERLAGLGKLIGPTAHGQESVKIALEITEVWLGLTRDLLLLDFGRGDLLQNQIAVEELIEQKPRFSQDTKGFLRIIRSLQKGKEYLMANVNPRLVLEDITINI